MSVVYRRFRQLMFPFLIWSIALFYARHNVEHYYHYILSPNLSLWFLWALFFITTIFVLTDWASQKLGIPQMPVMIATSIVLMGLILIVHDAKFLGVEYVSYYFFFYILGYYLHKYELIKRMPKNWIVVLLLLWLVLAQFWEAKETPAILRWATFVPSMMMQTGYRMVTAIVAILALFGCVERWSGDTTKVSKKLIEFGQISLGIYAVHMVIRFLLVEGIVFVLPQIEYWPLMILTFLILLPMTYLLVKLFSKNKWTAEFLLGKLR